MFSFQQHNKSWRTLHLIHRTIIAFSYSARKCKEKNHYLIALCINKHRAQARKTLTAGRAQSYRLISSPFFSFELQLLMNKKRQAIYASDHYREFRVDLLDDQSCGWASVWHGREKFIPQSIESFVIINASQGEIKIEERCSLLRRSLLCHKNILQVSIPASS